MGVDAQGAPPAAAAASTARDDHASLKLAGVTAAVSVAAAIWPAPTPTGLSLLGHRALALFGCIFVLCLTEAAS